MLTGRKVGERSRALAGRRSPTRAFSLRQTTALRTGAEQAESYFRLSKVVTCFRRPLRQGPQSLSRTKCHRRHDDRAAARGRLRSRQAGKPAALSRKENFLATPFRQPKIISEILGITRWLPESLLYYPFGLSRAGARCGRMAAACNPGSGTTYSSSDRKVFLRRRCTVICGTDLEPAVFYNDRDTQKMFRGLAMSLIRA